MLKLSVLIVTTVSFWQVVAQDIAPQLECGSTANSRHRLSASINSKRNDSGEWVTSFSAARNSSSSTKNINLDVTQRVVECQGNQIIHIQGVIKESSLEDHKASFLFHKKCSSHAAIINNGRTLQKIKLDGQGTALTDRPLADNEIFTVRLDKKNTKLGYEIGIGITTHSPMDIDVPNHMNSLSSGTWMFYHMHLYQNGKDIYQNYLKVNLKDIQVGDRVGVMRSSFGTLHCYINGVDQGPAASSIPYPVYGAFELYGDAMQGTIVDP